MFRKDLIDMLLENAMTVSQIARLVDESPWLKGSKRRAIWAGAMPMPESSTRPRSGHRCVGRPSSRRRGTSREPSSRTSS